MNLDDVAAFLSVAELKSVSGAARALKAPKSSVSRSLARLESAVGAELISRSTRMLKLTEAGRLFHPHALRIRGDVAEAQSALAGLTGIARGTLRVRAAFAFAQAVIAPMLPDFLARYPEVQVFLDANDSSSDVLPEWADVVINRGPVSDAASIARALPSVEIWLCASPAYVAGRGVPRSIDDLRAHDVVDRDVASKWTFNFRDQPMSFDCHARVIIPDAAAQKQVLVRGYGIGRLPDYLARPSVAAGELVRVLAEYAVPPVEITAVYPSHRNLSARVHVFIEALHDHMARCRA